MDGGLLTPGVVYCANICDDELVDEWVLSCWFAYDELCQCDSR